MAFKGIFDSKEPFETKIKDFATALVTKLLPGYTRYQVNQAAMRIVEGYPCLLPNDTIYTVIFDGNRVDLIEKMRHIKRRRPEQREALALPPQELIKYVDLQKLKALNAEVDENTILSLYEAHPRLGVVFPCLDEKVPSHLITPREVQQETIPTALGVWNTKYPVLTWLWETVSRFPHVLLVGSSANITGEPSMNFWEIRQKFASCIPYKLAIRDPKVERHPQRGSYPIIDLIATPPTILRWGNLLLEKPVVLEKLQQALPSLNYSKS